MRKLVTLLLITLMTFSPLVQANQCFDGSPQTPLIFKTEVKMATDICVQALKEKGLPANIDTSFNLQTILPMIGGCLMGAGDTAATQLKGYAYLVKLFVKEIPLYVYHKVEDYFSNEDAGISTVDKVCQENISVIDKAKKLATQYYGALKTFLKQVNLMVRKDYKSFFCYPKEVQARILCRMISTVFLILYSPSNMIKGVSFVKELPKLARLGLNFLIDSGPTVGNLYNKAKNIN